MGTSNSAFVTSRLQLLGAGMGEPLILHVGFPCHSSEHGGPHLRRRRRRMWLLEQRSDAVVMVSSTARNTADNKTWRPDSQPLPMM